MNGVYGLPQFRLCSATVEIAEAALLQALFYNGVKVECDESDLGVSLGKRFASLAPDCILAMMYPSQSGAPAPSVSGDLTFGKSVANSNAIRARPTCM